MAKSPVKSKRVEALKHEKARRINVPTAELQSLAEQQEEVSPVAPLRVARARRLPKGETRERDPDLDPQIVWNGVRIRLTKEQMAELAETGEIEIGDAQLVWRGKDRQDWSDLVVQAPMLYVQETVQPKHIIDDLKRRTGAGRDEMTDAPDLFAGLTVTGDAEDRTDFYRHTLDWQNRMILGDSLQVMASLAEREALRGKVQCIYFDPPYGIKFNSNWQVSTLSRDVKDGKAADISREPEQVRAFRDTWKDGIHSYLTYLRDRLTVARELLTESGSIFVQIGDENVHRVRALMDEVFGEENFVTQIVFVKTAGATSQFLPGTYDVALFYAKRRDWLKFHPPMRSKSLRGDGGTAYNKVELAPFRQRQLTKEEKSDANLLRPEARIYRIDNLTSQSVGREKGEGAASWFPVELDGAHYRPSIKSRWKTSVPGMERLKKARRLEATGSGLYYVRYFGDFPVYPESDVWTDTGIAGFTSEKRYVVETSEKVIQRCILMTTDPGDLVLDPTCGSGTTATVAEQWGRRWITLDTSRVALALARTRLMSARYPYYLLADSPEGRAKERQVTGRIQPDTPTHKDVALGFVYERVPHVTLKSIANNADIDIIWETWQRTLEPLREALNARLSGQWSVAGGQDTTGHQPLPTNHHLEEWQIPRHPGDPWPEPAAKLLATARDAGATDKKRQTALAKLNVVLGRKFALATLPDAPVDPWEDAEAIRLHAAWWEARIARQREIDASIAKAADTEYLYDRPYTDNSRVRVAGPFTVESLAASFTSALDRLSGDEQKRAKLTAFDLQTEPDRPGLQLHRIDNSKDPNFWSVRVSRDVRIVVHKSGASLLLVYVGHHDDAYRWAERRRIEAHPKTGAVQIVEVRERVEEAVATRPPQSEFTFGATIEIPIAAAKPSTRLFDRLDTDDLLSAGVPEDWVADVQNADEDGFLALTDRLPAEAAEALLDYVSSGVLKAPTPLPTGADPFAHPDTLRRFRVVENVAELEAALEYPWEK